MSSRLLVTGANGFIGKSLCQQVTSQGGYVRKATTKPVIGDDYHLDKITCDTNWEPALRNIDCIAHLAGRVHVMKEIVNDPMMAFRNVNVDGTLNLAKQAIDAGVKRFIFISTIKVNGEETLPGVPFNADDIPSPKDPYAISKWEAEVGLNRLAENSDMDVVIIRPPLVYGPGVSANFRALMMLLSKGIPLPFKMIDNKRSFIALDNIVNLIIRCVDHPAAGNNIYLASDGTDISTADLVSMIAKFMGKPAHLFSMPKALLKMAAVLSGQKAVAQRLLGSLEIDISKTERVLGWTPPVSIEEELEKTVAHFMKT